MNGVNRVPETTSAMKLRPEPGSTWKISTSLLTSSIGK
jgi:hypothetical protein